MQCYMETTGILNNAKQASIENEAGIVDEQVKLATTVLNLEITKNRTTYSSYDATKFINTTTDGKITVNKSLVDILEGELTDTKYTVTPGTSDITVDYNSPTYSKTFTISLTKKMATLGIIDNSEEEITDGWTQEKTIVRKGELEYEVGAKVTNYSAGGIDEWYILGAENGKLLITTADSVESMQLETKEGYKNGIATLNAAVASYKNSEYADSVRSINVDDINRITGYEPATAKCYEGEVYEYGNQVTYTKEADGTISYQGTKQPTEKTSSDATDFTYLNGSTWTSLTNAGDSATLTSTAYTYYPNTLTDQSSGETNGIELNSNAYALLFKGTDSRWYSLGSTWLVCLPGEIQYGLMRVNLYAKGNFGRTEYGHVTGEESDWANARPTVVLKADFDVQVNGYIERSESGGTV